MNHNRYLAAFKESFNVVGLTTAAAVSAALLNPLPILGALVLEAAYLLFVPDLKWYQQRLSRVHDADISKRREETKARVLPLLRPDMQHRFARMEAMLENIEAQSKTDAAREASGWSREVIRKLDFLLDKFLQFAAKDVQFRDYLFSVLDEVKGGSGVLPSQQAAPNRGPRRMPKQNLQHQVTLDSSTQNAVLEIQNQYDSELSELKKLCEGESDVSTQAVLEKRFEVVQRRREFVGKIGKVLTNLNHQLMLLEDTFGLISDELRARPPEQVLADIDDVVIQTKTMTELLEEMSPYESTLSRGAMMTG